MDERNPDRDVSKTDATASPVISARLVRWLPRLLLVGLLAAAAAWGVYAAYEATAAYEFAELAVPIAIGVSLAVAFVLVVAAGIAGLLRRPRLRGWLLRAAGVVAGGTIFGAIGALTAGVR